MSRRLMLLPRGLGCVVEFSSAGVVADLLEENLGGLCRRVEGLVIAAEELER